MKFVVTNAFDTGFGADNVSDFYEDEFEFEKDSKKEAIKYIENIQEKADCEYKEVATEEEYNNAPSYISNLWIADEYGFPVERVEI